MASHTRPHTAEPSEDSPLLADNASPKPIAPRLSQSPSFRVVPIAFLAALAISTTAPTEIYAYAALVCKDATGCQEVERKVYAGTVAVAVTIANVCALVMLGPFARLSRWSYRLGLLCWIVCRATNVVLLAVGVATHSLEVALVGRIFEGFASDNLLHLNLNSFYAQEEPQHVPWLMGLSLATYMLGISIGAALSSLLPSFETSFPVAVSVFALCAVYLIFIPSKTNTTVSSSETSKPPAPVPVSSILAPLKVLWADPRILLPCLSLLCYNLVQSFVMAAIMTFTTLQFGFTNKQNGWLLTIVHAIAAFYLCTSLFLGSYIATFKNRYARLQSSDSPSASTEPHHSGTRQVWSAITALAFEAISLMLLGFATKPWQIYALTAPLAFGLSTASWIKSYTATLVDRGDASQAMAALALFESVGSFLAPMVVGGLMTGKPGPTAFLASAGSMGLGGLVLVASWAMNRRQLKI